MGVRERANWESNRQNPCKEGRDIEAKIQKMKVEWVSFGNETGQPAEEKRGMDIDASLKRVYSGYVWRNHWRGMGESSGADVKTAMGIVQGETGKMERSENNEMGAH